jgi:hypothetical protein
MDNILENRNWTKWQLFPNPRKKGYLLAPFGFGVYQLFNKKTNEYVLFGSGNNCAYRMTSLLPKPFGSGTRRNENKRKYVLENISHIQYRCMAFENVKEMKDFEKKLKSLNCHIFSQ